MSEFLRNNNAEVPTPPVYSAADCFKMGESINQFRQLGRPRQPISSLKTDGSTGSYSSIGIIDTTNFEEPVSFPHVMEPSHGDGDKNGDEDDCICEIKANDQYRLHKS